VNIVNRDHLFLSSYWRNRFTKMYSKIVINLFLYYYCLQCYNCYIVYFCNFQ